MRSSRSRQSPRRRGSLTVVGTGIAGPAHTTREALAAIRGASRLFFLVSDPLTRAWLLDLAPGGEDLIDAYAVGRPRERSYEKMVVRILAAVRAGERVVAVFYGHPGVFADPPHEAIRRARREGFPARMQPGISAEDCLVAELGAIYPAAHEVVIYEASTLPTVAAKVVRLPLAELAHGPVTALSTLYVPPLPERDTDLEMARRLGLL